MSHVRDLTKLTSTVQSELNAFRHRFGFDVPTMTAKKTVGVYFGVLTLPMPAIPTRRKYLKYHDLHHLITGYGVGRVGEGKMSAWELGTGTLYCYPILGFMNLIALSTGVMYDLRGVWQAFLRGRRSENLYDKKTRKQIDTNSFASTKQLSQTKVDTRSGPYTVLAAVEFSVYCLLSLGIHACIAGPAWCFKAISKITGVAALKLI